MLTDTVTWYIPRVLGAVFGSFRLPRTLIIIAFFSCFPGAFSFAQQTHTVAGTITKNGAPLAGVTVRISGNFPYTVVQTNSAGRYSYNGVPDNAWVRIVPYYPQHRFEPSSHGTGHLTTDWIDADFTALDVSVAYTISGSVYLNGISVSGVRVIMTGDINDTVTTGCSGSYRFELIPQGSNVSVRAEYGNYQFQPASREYLNINQDYSGQTFWGYNFLSSSQPSSWSSLSISSRSSSSSSSAGYSASFSGGFSNSSKGSGEAECVEVGTVQAKSASRQAVVLVHELLLSARKGIRLLSLPRDRSKAISFHRLALRKSRKILAKVEKIDSLLRRIPDQLLICSGLPNCKVISRAALIKDISRHVKSTTALALHTYKRGMRLFAGNMGLIRYLDELLRQTNQAEANAVKNLLDIVPVSHKCSSSP